MGKIIAVANQKGGVGKTTTSVNLSACLGVLEKKILLIDADPQANATSSFGINDIENGTYQCLEHQKNAIECIQKTSSPNVDVMPAQLDLVAAELELVDKDSREFMLKEALKEVKNNYDYIIIDCAPSLGLITINALTAGGRAYKPLVTPIMPCDTEKESDRVLIAVDGVGAHNRCKRKTLLADVQILTFSI